MGEGLGGSGHVCHVAPAQAGWLVGGSRRPGAQKRCPATTGTAQGGHPTPAAGPSPPAGGSRSYLRAGPGLAIVTQPCERTYGISYILTSAFHLFIWLRPARSGSTWGCSSLTRG